MSEDRSAYGFPLWPDWMYGSKWTHEEQEKMRIARLVSCEPFQFNRIQIPRRPTKLDRAQAYAAEVRTRRNMIVRRITDEVKPIVGD